MKEFLQFVFGFLYDRNWNTGRVELSRPRVAIFCTGVFMIMLALTVISFMQAPLEVDNITGLTAG